MTDLTAVNAWTARLWALTADIELSTHQTPLNSREIREATLRVGAHGPAASVRPTYVPVPAHHVERLTALSERLAAVEEPLVDLVRQSLSGTLAFARALTDRSPEAITAYGRDEYGTPTPELVTHAEAILARRPEGTGAVDGPVVDAAEIARVVERVLSALGVQGWTAVVREQMGARMAVASSAREVRIRADATVTDAQLRGLLVHEVGTHVLRADEGSRQPLHLLARGLPGYLETEEGLATHHEALVDPHPDRMRTFALRVLAGQTALDGGLAAVMERLTAHTSPTLAFPIALRAKRGMADLTAPGSPLKDIVYLRGRRSVGAHLDAHLDDHAILLAGKLGLQHLDLARSLKSEGLLTISPPRVTRLIEEARMASPPWI